MNRRLREYFPHIKTREEVLDDIRQNNKCADEFARWHVEQQEEFLDFVTGVQGIKMTYDSFFKEIMNPEVHPERLEDFLSLILGQHVRIRQVLPNDSVRIADETSLLITDIVVEMEDGSLANVEIQKIGYAFPGQRGACYSADLLLRQYKRVKGIRKKKFNYRDMKTVYTIVLFEKSTSAFHGLPSVHIHRAKQVFDSGLKLDMLQKYVFIPLDIYKKSKHNKTVESKLDAWLSFISDDSPERILEIVEKYPDFRTMYDEVYQLCRNIEGVMDMFSKELLELDRNTVQYMIEEQEKENEELKRTMVKVIEEKDQVIEEKVQVIEEKDQVIVEHVQQLEEQKRENIELKKTIESLRQQR